MYGRCRGTTPPVPVSYTHLDVYKRQWLDRNNYQQIYGMNKVYQAKIGYWGVSTSNFWMFPAFTACANGRNLFCAMYSAADGGIPAVVTDYNAVEGSGRDTVYTAVSGSQARLLVPVVRHWSEVADERAGEPGHAIEDEKKLDEFYQNMEEPFKISLFAENQVVMKNITAGRNVQNNGASSAGTVHYQDPVTGNYLSFINPFEANNGTSYYQTSPSFDDIGGGWITGDGQVTKSGAKYPLPVLSTLLPEGIVPVDEQGKPWPGPSVPKEERDAWANGQADFDLTVLNVSTLQDGTANREITSGTNVTKDHYRVSVSYIEEARRYMVRVVPVAANAEGLDYNPLTDPQNHGDVVEVLNAPRLDWNQSLDINVKVMAVEAPEDRVNLDGVSQEASWAKRGAEDSNIMLNRWQQNRSFASSLVRGFRFLTDDRSVEEDNGLSMKLMFNPFSVGQEYSGYYMDGKYCNWYGCHKMCIRDRVKEHHDACLPAIDLHIGLCTDKDGDRNSVRQEDEEATIDEWLQNVMLMTDMDKDDPEDRNKVTLMTVHSAKGLCLLYTSPNDAADRERYSETRP